MLTETISIEIEGKEITDLYPFLNTVEVELDDELPAMFRLRFPLLLQPDGSWTALDDERLRVWNKVVIDGGLEQGLERLITGHITHVKPAFDPDPTRCILDVWGLDRSVLLDREDKLVAWPNKKDSDIASDIFNAYGFGFDIQDTEVVHDEAVSTVIQRETDWQFLNRLAMRNGFECYIEDSFGYFGERKRRRAPQALLAVQFGEETNVQKLALEVNALTPANVEMFQLERESKLVVTATVESSDQPTLGAVGAVPGKGIEQGLVVLGQTAATGVNEMSGISRALFDKQQWFVTGHGELSGNVLGSVLRPRRPVTIKGIGETFSGVYLVSHVTHAFSNDGYIQRFEVKRNGLMPTGSEAWGGGAGGLLGGLL
jgi:phage protein D